MQSECNAVNEHSEIYSSLSWSEVRKSWGLLRKGTKVYAKVEIDQYAQLLDVDGGSHLYLLKSSTTGFL